MATKTKVAKRPRIYVDVTPELRKRIKVYAALDEMTVSEFIRGCILDRVMEDEDARTALEILAAEGGQAVPLEQFEREESKRRGVGSPNRSRSAKAAQVAPRQRVPAGTSRAS